jgi:hypothetical protein
MISFSQFLKEALNSALPYSEPIIKGKEVSYRFDLPHDNDKCIQVSFGRPDKKPRWLVFSIVAKNGTMPQNFYMTNTNKNQFQIMSTVIEIVRKHFKTIDILKSGDQIEFEADKKDHGRVVLYRRLAKGLAKEINGNYTEEDYRSEVIFRIEKI